MILGKNPLTHILHCRNLCAQLIYRLFKQHIICKLPSSLYSVNGVEDFPNMMLCMDISFRKFTFRI